MKHIHYISDNKTVCEKPSRLGHDFVVVGTQFGPSCHICSDLLFAHNLHDYDRERRGAVYTNHPSYREVPVTSPMITSDRIMFVILLIVTIAYLAYLTEGFGFFA